MTIPCAGLPYAYILRQKQDLAPRPSHDPGRGEHRARPSRPATRPATHLMTSVLDTVHHTITHSVTLFDTSEIEVVVFPRFGQTQSCPVGTPGHFLGQTGVPCHLPLLPLCTLSLCEPLPTVKDAPLPSSKWCMRASASCYNYPAADAPISAADTGTDAHALSLVCFASLPAAGLPNCISAHRDIWPKLSSTMVCNISSHSSTHNDLLANTRAVFSALACWP